MIHNHNQNLISIDTGSMGSWGDCEPEQLHQCIDKIEHMEDSVEIVGLELLLEHTYFDSDPDDATRSTIISTPVDSLYLTRERNPGLVRISPDVRREAPGRAKKRTKPHRAGRSRDGTFNKDYEDGEVDSLILNRVKLAIIHNDRIHRRQKTMEKETSKEEPQLPFKHHDRTCPNAFPGGVAMAEPNIMGFNCAA
jgi:hypothetical protein